MSELKQELELQKSALMRVEREKVLISNGKPQWFIIVTLHEGCEERPKKNFWKELKLACIKKTNIKS